MSVADESGFAFDRGALENTAIATRSRRCGTACRSSSCTTQKAVIGKLGLPPRTIDDDPMIAAHVLDPARTYTDINQAASAVLHRELPEDPSAAADAASRITRAARAQLEARNQLALYTDVEVPLAVVLAKIERAGVALDPDALVDLRARVDADVERLQGEILRGCG